MNQLIEILEDIERQIAPSDSTIRAARERRDEVRVLASKYEGALRTYISGSIAHHTANDDTDADCGVVLDRRVYPHKGPDGDNEGPCEIVHDVREYLREQLKINHSDVQFRVTKRAIRITFSEPLPGGVDPSVDLIVTLTRREGALWIPNTERHCWNPSDPECHTSLLMAEPASLRRLRARVIRLAKAWNKQYAQPGLCSFNIEVLALDSVYDGSDVASGLSSWFAHAARELASGLTKDPAGVSPPIKILVDRDIVVGRLRHARDLVCEAGSADSDDKTRDAAANVFWHYVTPPAGSISKAGYAAALRQGNAGFSVVSGNLVPSSEQTNPDPHLKTTRAYGGSWR